jgi:pimeloyl-ACP methyl ester carboxylesterase
VTATPAFASAGEGSPPLLFLHGIGGTRASFDAQLATFGAAWRAVAWDMPGYGASPALPRMTFPALADAAVRLLDHLGVGRAVVVGHSMGGMVAQELCVAHADRVAAAVLYATTPMFGSADGAFQQRFLAERLAPLDRGLTPADLAPRVVGGMLAPGAPAAARERAIAGMAAITAAAYRAALKCLVTFDRRADLGRIACPVLALAAELDALAPPETMARMAERIPGARYACLPGVGHLAHLEAPARFDAAVAEFVAALGAPGGGGAADGSR